MRCANDLVAVLGEKPVGVPVERMARMHAEVLVRKNFTPATHNKTLEWPLALADSKFTASGIVKVVQLADYDFYILIATHRAAQLAYAGQ